MRRCFKVSYLLKSKNSFQIDKQKVVYTYNLKKEGYPVMWLNREDVKLRETGQSQTRQVLYDSPLVLST